MSENLCAACGAKYDDFVENRGFMYIKDKPMPMIIMLVAAFILGCVGDRLNRTLRKQIGEEVKEA